MKVPLWHRAQSSIAQNCLTNSKSPHAHVYGVAPTHIVKAKGCEVWDENGKRYIDYMGALGANFLGYGNETVNRAATQAMSMGVSHSLGTQFEIAAAERLKQVFPFIDKVKWVKTGSEACSAAIKIARAHTGRNLILSHGYHGWHQEFCDAYNGELHERVRKYDGIFGEITSLRRTRNIAAIIIEPVITDLSAKRLEWLKDIMGEAKDAGALVIFDEVITNLRFSKYSVANYWNLEPDIFIGGKAIANGFPLAFVGGKAAMMDNPGYFVSGTYAGDVVSLAAADAVMQLLLSKKFDVEQLWAKGWEFIAKFNAMSPTVKLEGYPTRGVVVGSELEIALFLQETVKAGLLFGKSWNFSFHHTAQDIQDRTFTILDGVFTKLRYGQVTLEGEIPKNPLAMKVRQ